MTEELIDQYESESGNALNAEALSERLERESRRYSRSIDLQEGNI